MLKLMKYKRMTTVCSEIFLIITGDLCQAQELFYLSMSLLFLLSTFMAGEKHKGRGLEFISNISSRQFVKAGMESISIISLQRIELTTALKKYCKINTKF